MNTISTKELKERLEKHLLFIDSGGVNGEYADFANYEFRNISLLGYNLSGINFSGSDFTKADLKNTDFTNANLENCIFNRANLSYSILIGANMKGAKLINANMAGATVSKANLSSADLTGIKSEKLLHSGADFTEAIMDDKLKQYIGITDPPELDVSRYQIQHEPFSVHSMNISPCFDVEHYATVFAEHIRHLKSESGQMVGVFGQWGRGKTYFFNKVWKDLDSTNSLPGKEQFQLITFNPWKYQDTPAIWAYLYETIYKGISRESRWKRFKYFLSKEWWRLALIVIGSIPLVISLIVPATTTITIGSISIAIIPIILLVINWVKKNSHKAIDLIRKYNKGIFNTTLGIQAEIETELEKLLVKEIPDKEIGQKRILLFVDDIDRCSQYKLLELIDSLRIVLDNENIMKRLIIVCACDEDKLCAAIRLKYCELYPDTDVCNKIVYEYIDKLFISGIKLPEIPNDKYDSFIDKLIESNEESEISSNLSNSIPSNSSPIEQNSNININVVRQNPENITTTQDIDKLIKQTVIDFKETLTPRRVRIFYYRYKLAKNIYSIHSNDLDVKLLLDGIKRRMEGEQIEDIDDANLRHVIRMVVAYTNENYEN